MNSSVTLDSATSVTSSLCLAIRLQQQVEGPLELFKVHLEASARPRPVSARRARERVGLGRPFLLGHCLLVRH